MRNFFKPIIGSLATGALVFLALSASAEVDTSLSIALTDKLTSFIKIGSRGETLPASATSWACVKDKVTGLMWEIKTADGGLRDKKQTYTNVDSTLHDQWRTGTKPTTAEINARTNALGFKNAVNAQNLCGAKDWRLPTADEMQSLVDYGIAPPRPDD